MRDEDLHRDMEMDKADAAADAAWQEYWGGLLARSAALASYADHQAIRGLKFGGFREALEEAFHAGRQSRS